MQQIIFFAKGYLLQQSPKVLNDQKRSDLVILQQTSIFQSSQQSWYGKLFAICIIEERDDVSFVPDSNLFKLNQMGRRFR